jgi:UDP-GlcNAc3NAcA epimerase
LKTLIGLSDQLILRIESLVITSHFGFCKNNFLKKILTIVGARPQFIKAAVVSRAMTQTSGITEVLIHTGQHYDSNMSDIFFDELDIPRPHHHLGIGGGTHGQNTGRMLEKLEALMQVEKPDWVLVYGDTDSTLAGALAASKLHIPVAHVEAGLRSFNRRMPEEVNRILTDHMSSLLFAPTATAVKHLANEGIGGNKVQVVGDVMYDAALFYKARAKPPVDFALAKWALGSFALCTVHRAENTDNVERMSGILTGLASAPYSIILPIHPRTRVRLAQMGLTMPSNVHVIDPVSYLEMAWLEMNCRLVVTDSGGVQKEAYFHGKSCVTLRDETEWTELIELGVNQLVGVDPRRIAKSLSMTVDNTCFHNKEIYGSGQSGVSIAQYLLES